MNYIWCPCCNSSTIRIASSTFLSFFRHSVPQYPLSMTQKQQPQPANSRRPTKSGDPTALWQYQFSAHPLTSLFCWSCQCEGRPNHTAMLNKKCRSLWCCHDEFVNICYVKYHWSALPEPNQLCSRQYYVNQRGDKSLFFINTIFCVHNRAVVDLFGSTCCRNELL